MGERKVIFIVFLSVLFASLLMTCNTKKPIIDVGVGIHKNEIKIKGNDNVLIIHESSYMDTLRHDTIR